MLDDVPVDHIREFEEGLYKYADLHNEVLRLIAEKQALDKDIEQKLKSLIVDYKLTIDYLIK